MFEWIFNYKARNISSTDNNLKPLTAKIKAWGLFDDIDANTNLCFSGQFM